MGKEQRRHGISDRGWEKIEPYTIGEKGNEAGMLETPGSLSTEYSGFCAPERLGGTCQKLMKTGRMYTDGFVDGEIREFGKGFWKRWWMTQTLSG